MTQKQILLVDDEPNIRLVLTAVLQKAGYTVDSAEDGYVALRKIQKTKPDLVITDLRMPNMNGFELLSVLRTRFPELPTIAISGEFLAVDVQEGPLADAFFQKGNYDLPEFLSRISDLLSVPRQPQKPRRDPPLWTPTGDAPLMLTCTNCLRSFPIDLSDGLASKQANCIFCGQQLEIQLLAIGVAQKAG